MKKELSLTTFNSQPFSNATPLRAGYGTGTQNNTRGTHFRVFRKILALILFALSIYPGWAQNIIIDNTRNELTVSKDDTTKVLLSCRLSFNFRNTDIDSSKKYANAALSLARQINYPRGEANAMSNLGFFYYGQGELPRAFQLELGALEIAENQNYLVEKGNSLRRMGIVYYELGEYQKALDFCGKAMACHRQIGDSLNIGIDYLSATTTYIDMNNPDSAWFCIQKAAEKINTVKDFEPELYYWRGAAYALKKNKDSALADWNKGLQTGLTLKHYRPVSRIYQKMGNLYRKMNQPDSSIVFAKKALEFAKKISNLRTIQLSSQLLFELYDSLHQPEALYYLKIASAAKDSLLGPENMKTILEIIANDNAKQKEILTEKASYQSRLRQIMLATGMGAILIIAILLYVNNRKKQQTNIMLGKQKTEIQETLSQLKATQSQLIQSEKMASLGELTAGIAHEIQNPLNFVNNFSEVNTELMQEMEHEFKSGNASEAFALAETIKLNIEKVNEHGKRADAIVKSMLQHTRASSGQKELTDINALADEYLRLSYQGLKARDKSFNSSIKTDFDGSIGKINIIPQDISRVLLNLYNNAFYAVKEKELQSPNEYKPNVLVTTRRANGMVEITVKDNGNGIPENIRQKIFQPFFTTKPAGQGTGLGLSLSYDIIKAQGGEIKLSSENGKGSEFTVCLPLS
jgi:signal transduction histidine kinase